MDKKIELEPMYEVYGSTMQFVAWIGISILLLFGFLYMIGVMPGNISPEECMNNWNKPTTQFWRINYGREVDGYGWFLNHLGTGDSLSLLGVALLALTPCICLFLAALKAPRMYKVILFILFIELSFVVIRPLIMGGSG